MYPCYHKRRSGRVTEGSHQTLAQDTDSFTINKRCVLPYRKQEIQLGYELMENPHGSHLSRAASLPMILASQGGDPIRPLRSKFAISWSISYLLSSSKYSQDSGFIFLATGDTWLINSVRSLIYSPHHLIIQHTFTKFLERDTSFGISLEEDQALLLKDRESRWGIRYRTK